MPGPPPKPPALRQRRNKASTRATLSTATPQRPPPPLPDRGCPCAAPDECGECEGTGIAPWHPLVLEWWRDVWSSPMAPEYLEADVHGLFIVAQLRDQFWRTGSRELAAEIRLQEQRFGLSSLDRRRLQWEIERGERAAESGARRRAQQKRGRGKTADPRKVLRFR